MPNKRLSPAIKPVPSITSASPRTLGCLSNARTSSGSIAPPAVSSPRADGTLELTKNSTFSRIFSEAAKNARIPAAPNTLAISCGSSSTVVVPNGNTASAKCAGVIIVLSICKCESTKLGVAIMLWPSITRLACRGGCKLGDSSATILPW